MRINLSCFFCRAVGARLQPALIAILFLCGGASQAASTNRLFLAWDNAPDYDTNLTFHVYSSTNAAQPVSQWLHLTNVDFVTATNAAKAGEGGRLEILPAEDALRFYSITASNFTGESDFSESVSVRRLLTGTRLRLGAIQ